MTVRFQRSTSGVSHQSANLRRLLQQIDAQWEALADSLQEDQHMLRVTQQHWENLHLIFALDPEPQLNEYPAITAYLKTAEQVMQQIQQTMLLKQEELKELERQFDQARLAGTAAQQKTCPGQSMRRLVIRYFLINSLARPLRILWKIPHPTRGCHGHIAHNALLKSVQQQSKNREKEPSQSN
jgi:hypothetical protein